MHHAIDHRLKAVEKAIERAYEAIIEGDQDLAIRIEMLPSVRPAFGHLHQTVEHLRALLSHERITMHLLRVLNQALAADPEAVQELVDDRVHLRRIKAWARHPTLTALRENGKVVVGLLGIVNGFRFSDDEPRIAARYDHGNLAEFILLEEEASEDLETRSR